MSADVIPFNATETTRLYGRRVLLMQPLCQWPAGTTGQVTDYQKFMYGYIVQVTWDGPALGRLLTFDYFTKDDFAEYLREC